MHGVNPALVAVRVVLPTVIRIRLENVATPLTAETVVVDPAVKLPMLALTLT
jgi:hypothetical protein